MREVFLLFTLLWASAFAADPQFMIGIGKADITGPAADVGMMGFAHPDQRTGGIHTRLFSRAFITCEIVDPTACNVFVSADIAMGCTALNLGVFKILAEDADLSRYTEKNTILSGTHGHSGPGGYLQYFTFLFTTLGYVDSSHEAIVVGMVESIRRAHANLQLGNVYVNSGDLFDSNMNRSPTSYLENPEEERAKYLNDTDTLMTVAKFVADDGTDLGLISWFPVHPVSMNNTNHLISADNKGYASYLAEHHYGNGDFVAAFANSDQGDVSPNLNGPLCMDTGLPCEPYTSTCDGRAPMCVASGPGKDMFESTKIIGEKQYNKAVELYDSASKKMTGIVGSIHQFINMTTFEVDLEDGSKVKTCAAGLGYAFAGGTIDGPGALNFHQGDTTGTRLWDFIRDLLKEPSEEMQACHAPKPVLLATGEAFNPWQWHPDVVATQVLQIGELFINAVPGEFTTMSGRRFRDAMYQVLADNGFLEEDANVVLTGLSNTYTHYITTPEEYRVQRYEAGSTIYGINELQAFIQQYSMLTDNLVQGNEGIDPGPLPVDLLDELNGLLPPTTADSFPDGKAAGDIFADVDPKYRQGGLAYATFHAGNPRHEVIEMLENTFLEVQKKTGPTTWEPIFTDNDWETRFYWGTDHKKSTLPGTATVYWEIPVDQEINTYRLLHRGFIKTGLIQRTEEYSGTSSEFEVVSVDYARSS